MGDIIEIGDLSVEQATQYLICRGVNENIPSVLNITGTRFTQMGATATQLGAGASLEDCRASLSRRVSLELWGLRGVSPAPPGTRGTLDEAFWTIVDGIVQHGAVTKTFFDDTAPEKDDNDILYSFNIFLIDHFNEQVTFRTRAVELYMRATMGVFQQQRNAMTD